MNTLDKVEEYLIDLGIGYQELSPTAWFLEDETKGIPAMVASHAGPIVMIRAEVMKLPQSGKEALFTKLLTLNSSDLLHGAYALDGDKVIILDTLEYEGMDKNEFGASLEAMGFALAEHYPVLSRFEEK